MQNESLPATSFRKYLQRCESMRTPPRIARKPEGSWCCVREIKNQYNKTGKDGSKAKIHDPQTGRSYWIRFSKIEEEWRWLDA